MEKYATVVFDEELFIHGLGQCGSKVPVFRVFRASLTEAGRHWRKEDRKGNLVCEHSRWKHGEERRCAQRLRRANCAACKHWFPFHTLKVGWKLHRSVAPPIVW